MWARAGNIGLSTEHLETAASAVEPSAQRGLGMILSYYSSLER